MALVSGGGQAEYVTVPEGLLMPIPKDMTFIQAAAIPEAWLTAFQLLHFVGEGHILHICPTEQLVFLSVRNSSICCLYLYAVCLQRTFYLLLHSHGSESSMPHADPEILTTSTPSQFPLLLHICKEGYGQMVSFPCFCISQRMARTIKPKL